MISAQNWSHSYFEKSALKAQIGLVATPDCPELFSVSLVDENFQEYECHDFNQLDLAINYINSRYHDWEFKDLSQKSDSGCDSCSAH